MMGDLIVSLEAVCCVCVVWRMLNGNKSGESEFVE